MTMRHLARTALTRPTPEGDPPYTCACAAPRSPREEHALGSYFWRSSTGPLICEDLDKAEAYAAKAPEESVRGSLIDIRTSVFALGRTLRLLLDAGDEERQWRGTPEQLRVVRRATATAPEHRFSSVRALVDAWQAAACAHEPSARPAGPAGVRAGGADREGAGE